MHGTRRGGSMGGGGSRYHGTLSPHRIGEILANGKARSKRSGRGPRRDGTYPGFGFGEGGMDGPAVLL